MQNMCNTTLNMAQYNMPDMYMCIKTNETEINIFFLFFSDTLKTNRCTKIY